MGQYHMGAPEGALLRGCPAPEDDQRVNEAQAAGGFRSAHRGMDRRKPGTFTEFLDGLRRDAGMGQINHDFVGGQPVRHPAGDHEQCPNIFRCDNAVHFYPRRIPLGIDADDDFQPRVPNMVVHGTVRAPWPQPEVP